MKLRILSYSRTLNINKIYEFSVNNLTGFIHHQSSRIDVKTNSIDKAPRVSPAKGVEIIILGHSDKVMLVHIIAQQGSVIADHSHPHDQIGTCIRGEGELVSGGKKFKTVPGASWSIPGGETHSWINTAKSETILIETFSPPREDYLSKAK